MKDRPLLLVFDNNPDFGGHQVMALAGLRGLLARGDLDLLVWSHPANARLSDRLKDLPGLRCGAAPVLTRRLQGIRNLWERAFRKRLAEAFRAAGADGVLVIQGDIEDASMALLAAADVGLPCVSYIPVPHRLSLMGAKLGAPRDWANAPLFAKPTAWITISDSMATLLRGRGARQEIRVVPNGVRWDDAPMPAKAEARAAFGLAPDMPCLGFIGRIERKQKQVDWLLRAFEELAERELSGWQLAFAGSGPDEALLDQAIAASPCAARVRRIPWVDKPRSFYAALDLLAVPSRFEGVPLVMLEALGYGLPVVGSDRDGMRDTLPASWRFPVGDVEAFARALASARAEAPAVMPALAAEIRERHAMDRFESAFAEAVASLISRDGAGAVRSTG